MNRLTTDLTSDSGDASLCSSNPTPAGRLTRLTLKSRSGPCLSPGSCSAPPRCASERFNVPTWPLCKWFCVLLPKGRDLRFQAETRFSQVPKSNKNSRQKRHMSAERNIQQQTWLRTYISFSQGNLGFRSCQFRCFPQKDHALCIAQPVSHSETIPYLTIFQDYLERFYGITSFVEEFFRRMSSYETSTLVLRKAMTGYRF